MSRQATYASDERLQRLHEDATVVGNDVVRLERFITLNTIGFRKITKKFDKVFGERALVWLEARLDTENFCNLEIDRFIITLSDIWSVLRDRREVARRGREDAPLPSELKTPATAPKKTWQPPSDFERSTTKYWVRILNTLCLVSAGDSATDCSLTAYTRCCSSTSCGSRYGQVMC